ncbi:MAG TPA: EAL domain-containing protein [Actinobacteria bacterium]|nr:EAL domain-containing protein [Actinomycetota bacterium]
MVNERTAMIFGYKSRELIGKPISFLMSDKERALYIRALNRYFKKPRAFSTGTINKAIYAQNKDGAKKPVDIGLSPVKLSSRDCFLLIVRDATENRTNLEKALHEAQEKYKLLIENIPCVAWVADEKRAMRFISPNVYKILGYTPEEIYTGGPGFWSGKIFQDDREQYEKSFEELFKGEEFLVEYRIQKKDGNWIWGRDRAVSIFEKDNLFHAYGIFTDISERKRIEERVQFLAFHDQVTSLPNRALLRDRLNQVVAFAERSRRRLAILYIGLDQFKRINDTLGHDVGDKMLRGVSSRLIESLRKGDTVARVGGDEFCVALANISRAQDAAKVAQSLSDGLDLPFTNAGRDFFITAGIGISLYPDDAKDPETLINHAEAAMHHAKEKGRNHREFYTSSMQSTVSSTMALENDLAQAVKHNEFVVYYQPHVDLNTGEIIGLEALGRWQHPQKGLIQPLDFIPLAEETGLIVPIGESVLRTACKQAKVWLDEGSKNLVLAVNLSALQLQREEFIETVSKVLKETNFPTHRLMFELTETAVIDDVEKSAKMMGLLKNLGIHLAIDDFGTGFSSLWHLTSLPFDTMKISGTFVKEIATKENSKTMINAIVSLGKALGMDVIVEGVETVEQLNCLRGFKSLAIQGSVFSWPVSARAFGGLLREKRRFQRLVA